MVFSSSCSPFRLLTAMLIFLKRRKEVQELTDHQIPNTAKFPPVNRNAKLPLPMFQRANQLHHVLYFENLIMEAIIETKMLRPMDTLYSLHDIADCYKLPIASQTSDDMAKSIIEQIVPGVIVSSGSITPAAQCLSSLYTSSDQRPDVVVKGNDGEFLFIVEVHSGDDSNSFLSTINKCVYVTINAIRLLQCVNSDVSEITSFVFPKSRPPKCVIKVEVNFEKFHFYYALNVVALADVRKTLMEVAETQSYSFPDLQEVRKYR